MPVMNATPLKRARADKFATEYGRGTGGFEPWQVGLGVMAAIIVAFLLWFPFSFIGIGIGIFAGYAAMLAPNLINTHYQHPRRYLQGLVKKRLNHSLLLNDKRVSDPKDEIELYFVEVSEFQPPPPHNT